MRLRRGCCSGSGRARAGAEPSDPWDTEGAAAGDDDEVIAGLKLAVNRGAEGHLHTVGPEHAAAPGRERDRALAAEASGALVFGGDGGGVLERGRGIEAAVCAGEGREGGEREHGDEGRADRCVVAAIRGDGEDGDRQHDGRKDQREQAPGEQPIGGREAEQGVDSRRGDGDGQGEEEGRRRAEIGHGAHRREIGRGWTGREREAGGW